MSFVAGLLPAVSKFGKSFIGDVLAGKNVARAAKRRGLEAIETIPVIGDLARPLAERGIRALEQKASKTRKGRQLSRKLGKMRLTPAGQQAAMLAMRRLIPNADEIIGANRGMAGTPAMGAATGNDGGSIMFDKFANAPEMPKSADSTSPAELKDFTQWQKWARGFIREQAESQGNNEKEIKKIMDRAKKAYKDSIYATPGRKSVEAAAAIPEEGKLNPIGIYAYDRSPFRS